MLNGSYCLCTLPALVSLTPSFTQHPDYSTIYLPLIRMLHSYAFGIWPIAAALRDAFSTTDDELAVPLMEFEERWGVDVFVPKPHEQAESADGGMEWCNVCVRMMRASGRDESECESAMDAVMLAAMKRAERIEHLAATR